MANEKFCLKWNDFESNISVAFRDLRDEKELFDITLACEDSQIQAHRVILSACSPFFRSVLKNNPHQHPLIYLRGMRYTDLESVLNFMYHGEVNVAQDELNSFLSVAEDLRVKGLTQNKNGESTPVKRPKSPVSKSRPPDRDSVPPAKRARPSPAPVAQDDDIQEVVPVKSEPRDIVPVVTQPPATYHSQAVVQQDEYIENYDEYEQYDDQYMEGQQQETDKGFFAEYSDVFEAEDYNSEYDLKLVKGARQNSVHLIVNSAYPCTLNTAKRFPFVQWKCTKYCSALRCPVVFWAYVSNHAQLRLLNPETENPLELAKDLRAVYRYIPRKDCKMQHNH